ncbi:hypothetical protein FJT64_025077 [Amphibalanus amphitrite]|uniref:Uncharacterized protein n=1 Tax=Amphibalanus amphitrite TaxID=1232801 RepID=A0A6A4WH23_AMPAM|nr:hypothetical protein FJT64_025077 [Amphibalanus amphitrite]
MDCALCGSEVGGGGGSTDTTLPYSKKTVFELLYEEGHPVQNRARLCDSCVSAVNELEWTTSRAVRAREKITERAMMKPGSIAVEEQAQSSEQGPTDQAAPGKRAAGDVPAEAASARAQRPPRPRKSRGWVRRRPKVLVRSESDENTEDTSGAHAGGAGGDGSGVVMPVDPRAVKKEPMDNDETTDEGGGGDGPAAGSASVPGVAKEAKNGKRPDWNERWRSRTLKNTSWRERLQGERDRKLLEAELANPLTIHPTERAGEEPGAAANGGAGAASSAVGEGAAQPPGESMFRVGRKVVTKQIDGSAAPAVKLVHRKSTGQSKVTFLDHKKAMRHAAWIDRVQAMQSGTTVLDMAGDETDTPTWPAKRKRPPRVLTKPLTEEPCALPSEVAWMAGGGETESPWLAPEGAVHAVLEVQPGEAWVDAIVRSEAAEDWGGGEQAQLPVPLTNIKSEPPE